MENLSSLRFVFSVLYNESTEFLPLLVNNFLSYTDADCALIINLPPDRQITLPSAHLSDRVFLINGEVKRAKVGHTLLFAHLEAFEHAVKFFTEFEYFCPMASNSLMFRRFNPEVVLLALEASYHHADIDIDNIPDEWWWSIIRENPAFAEFVRTTWKLQHVALNSIEGMFARRDDWGHVAARRSEIEILAAAFAPDQTFPFEEVMPASLIINFGSARYIHICHNLWERSHASNGHSFNGLARIDDFINPTHRYDTHVNILKWFRRSAMAIETAAVTRSWSQMLLADITAKRHTGDKINLLSQRMLLEALTQELRALESFVPLAARWESKVEGDDTSIFYAPPTLTASRQIVRLSIKGDECEEGGLAYLYMENTDDVLEVLVEVVHDSETIVRTRCALSGADALQPSRTLQGYLYLNTAWSGGNGSVIRMAVPGPASKLEDSATRYVVLCRAGSYQLTQPCHTVECNGHKEHYYFDDIMGDGDLWFGLPLFSGLSFEVKLAISNPAGPPSH